MKSVIWSSGTRLGAPKGGKGWFRSEASTGALKAAGWEASRSTHQRLPERPVPSANKTMCDKRRVRLLDDDEDDDEEDEDAAASSPPSRSRSRTRSYFLKTTPAVNRARSSSGVDSFPPEAEGAEEEEADIFWPGVEADTAQLGPLAVALAAARAPGEKGEEDEGVCGAAMCSSLLLGAAALELAPPPPPRAENEAEVEMDLLNEVGLSRPPPPPRPPGWCDRELGCWGAGEASPAPPPPPPLTALLL